MKSDLDALMQARQLEALVVAGPGRHNPAMHYLAGGAFFTDALLIKKRGQAPLLFHRSMERGEAAKTGLQTRDLEEHPIEELLARSGGDLLQAIVLRTRLIFEAAGVSEGRVALYGLLDAGQALAVFAGLQKELPGLTLVGELGDTLLLAAMQTKDLEEIERIRRLGQVTTAVVAQTADFLTSHKVARRGQEQVLVRPDGEPLTIGEVKRCINLWLAERGADNPEDTIFSIGREAGVPHSTGDPQDLLRLGQTIVFDIFPCEAGGGYFYDMTRTWCLGYATDETLALYQDVRTVYEQLLGELRLGAPCKHYQQRACELFQQRGHATVQETPHTLQGYVHSLGHGVGLYLHERPFFRLTSDENERLDANVVVTVEPGLYYPERGMGVRLEDTLWMRPDGRPETLAPYPMDLVLPLK
ncbi:MAG: M24 family metallopeptidase [Chloroflexota bacterium]